MESPILVLVLLGLLAICQAVPAPGRPCRPVLCRMYCPNGWAKDPVTGCDMCQCAKRCPPTSCMMECPFGFKKDVNGCNICQCAAPPKKKKCKPVMCRMYCPFGSMKDANGCTTCRCRRRPSRLRKPTCRRIRCKKSCPYGYVTRFGCPTCRCKKPRCTKKCPSGQECHRHVIYCFRAPCPPPREVCQKKCGENEVFKPCTSPCIPQATCENPRPRQGLRQCMAMCIPKCVCRAGFIWSNDADKCIGRGQCPQYGRPKTPKKRKNQQK